MLVKKVVSQDGRSSIHYRQKRSRLEVSFGETREGVLKIFQDWVTSTDHGVFGRMQTDVELGYPPLAWTIAEWVREGNGILGGSFLITYDKDDSYYSWSIIPSLASQLAQSDPHFARSLYGVLKEENDLLLTNVNSQFEGFIRKPLTAYQGERPILMMLNLDVFSISDDVKEILLLLLQFAVTSGGPKLHILITSITPALCHDLTRTLRLTNAVLYDFKLEENIAYNDMRTYLKAKLARSHHYPDWPSQEDFDKLVEQCGKSLHYAKTTLRFIGTFMKIGGPDSDPVSNLHEILEMKGNQPGHAANNANPYRNLDNLYLKILRAGGLKKF